MASIYILIIHFLKTLRMKSLRVFVGLLVMLSLVTAPAIAQPAFYDAATEVPAFEVPVIEKFTKHENINSPGGYSRHDLHDRYGSIPVFLQNSADREMRFHVVQASSVDWCEWRLYSDPSSFLRYHTGDTEDPGHAAG